MRSRIIAYSLLLVLLMTPGCHGGDTAAPPTQTQEQQRTTSLLNDPHVPQAVKQHLMDQRSAAQATATGYTAALKAKPQAK
jgi:hypothetical protein